MPKAAQSLSRRRLFGAIPPLALAALATGPSDAGTLAEAWRDAEGDLWWRCWVLPDQVKAIGKHAAALGLHPDDVVMVGREGRGAARTIHAYFGDPWGGDHVKISADDVHCYRSFV